ncbi:hypothetical protein MRBLMC3_000679 [Sphingobium sp. LMC3-1-1.1]|uniref:hypothetical protein n=1 Tax=Sphingobium sp. LMC3-1-1.1 TaxID=3135241 RepID=UPI003418AE4E
MNMPDPEQGIRRYHVQPHVAAGRMGYGLGEKGFKWSDNGIFDGRTKVMSGRNPRYACVRKRPDGGQFMFENKSTRAALPRPGY